MITVYKASAGSGKTFRLVLEYLKLILTNETNYRRILAVTFTNKAAAEMKERVVKQLAEIAGDDPNNPYTSALIKETGLPLKALKTRASAALKNILHDYSRFSISTIDKFTQRIIKAFNREIGISPGYKLELNTDVLLQEAIDRLLAKIGSNKELLNWLKNLADERIKNNKSLFIKSEIQQIGKELFKEQFQQYYTSKTQKLFERSELKLYKTELRKIEQSFVEHLKTLSSNALNFIAQNNLEITDFSYGKGGIVGFFEKLKENTIVYPGTRVLKGAENPETWVAKKHKNRDEVMNVVNTHLHPILLSILSVYDADYVGYMSAKKILGNLYTLGVLNDLQLEISELRHEKGILPISDSNLLLSRIISESDSPFIYEKLGNIYNHFMLDEFQDTSGLQWNNFKPLLLNSISEGKNNLVVGDVKQSIYRWRNSDWKILGHQIEHDFYDGQVNTQILENNWRSDSNIVEFNNAIFPILAKTLGDVFENDYQSAFPDYTTTAEESINNIYADVIQKQSNTNNNGQIEINFIEHQNQEEYTENTLELLLNQLKHLQDKGVEAKNTAILLRSHKQSNSIIRFLLEASEQPQNKNYNLSVVSNEALFLGSSTCAIFVVGIFMHLDDPADKIIKATLLNDFKRYLTISKVKINKQQNLLDFEQKEETEWHLVNTFEDEFEKLLGGQLNHLKAEILNTSIDEAILLISKTFGLFEFEEETPFLQALIDQAAQLKSSQGNNISSFLEWWDEKGYKQSVNVNENSNSIKLLTIHKSKGLEFEAVLIPFLNWPLTWGGNQSPTIWCHPHEAPFNAVPLVPLKATKDLAKTIFYKEYFNEILQSYIDNLNLVYVAFTRAKLVLMVNAPFKANEKNTNLQNLFYTTIKQISETKLFENSWAEENNKFVFGTLKWTRQSEKSSTETHTPSKYVFNEFSSRLKLRLNNDDFFEKDNKGKTIKNKGKIVHEIMAGIKTSTDVEKACKNALKQRKISDEEYSKIVPWISSLVQSDQVKCWFSDKYTIYNERNILSPNTVKRPDRLMISGDTAVIVDFKIGGSEMQQYNQQVMDYALEIKKTGIQKVTGYLWYLKTNNIEKVCEL